MRGMNQRSSVTVSAPTQGELRNDGTGNDVDFNDKTQLTQRCLKAGTPRIIAICVCDLSLPSVHQEAV